MKTTILIECALMCFISGLAGAQLQVIPMPDCGDDTTKLSSELKNMSDPTFILRAGAVGGEALVPTLRILSHPEQASPTIEAAQVALARLGDQPTMEELKKEIQGKPPDAIEAISKLSKVRSEASAAILMQYVSQNRRNPKRIIDEGDVAEDPVLRAIGALIGMSTDPLYTSPAYDQARLDEWEKWWNSTSRPRIVSIAEGFSDAESRCFARLAEDGFADGVHDLYMREGDRSSAALRTLADLGSDGTSPPALVQGGIAEAILAKSGDQQQFARVAKELNGLATYEGAITKLRYIANDQSFEALLESLTLSRFPKNRYYSSDNTLHLVGEKLQKQVMAALSEMVIDPPLPPHAPATETNIQVWNEWWQKKRGKDVVKTVPF